MHVRQLHRPDKGLEPLDNLVDLDPWDEHELALHVDAKLVLPAAFCSPRVVREVKDVCVLGELRVCGCGC